MKKKATKKKSKSKSYVDNGMPDGHPEDRIYKHHVRIIDQPVNPK